MAATNRIRFTSATRRSIPVPISLVFLERRCPARRWLSTALAISAQRTLIHCKARLDLPVRKAKKGTKAIPVQRALLVPTVHPVLKVQRVTKATPEQSDLKVQRATRVQWGPRVRPARSVRKVQRAIKATPVRWELQAQSDLKASKETKAMQEFLVPRVRRARKVRRVTSVPLAQ